MPALQRPILLILVILTAIAGYSLWLARHNFHTVIPGKVYRSAQLDSGKLLEIAKDYDIRSVINLRGAHPGESWYDEQRAAAAQLDLQYYDIRFPALGLPPVLELLELKGLLTSADAPILVHCRGGADRTGMASALVFLTNDDFGLSNADAQLSVKYFNFLPQSTGRILMKQYTDWLAATNSTHDAATFTQWLENDYVDANGNLQFYIDQINETAWKTGTRYEDGYEYVIDRRASPHLELSGWAVDIPGRRLIDGLAIYLDGKKVGDADYGYPYVGVARYFADDRYTNSGWMFREVIRDWNAGCYDLSLELERMDSSSWRSPAQARVCLR